MNGDKVPSSDIDDIFIRLGTDFETVGREIEEHNLRKSQICLCGHQMSKHTEFAGRRSCSSGRGWCPCDQPFAVVKVSDVRYFQRVTEGIGSMHALGLGLFEAKKNKKEVEWLVSLACIRCSNSDGRLYFCAYSADKRILRKPSKFNGVFCLDCIVAIESNVV